jgi:hypothetical protein
MLSLCALEKKTLWKQKGLRLNTAKKNHILITLRKLNLLNLENLLLAYFAFFKHNFLLVS